MPGVCAFVFALAVALAPVLVAAQQCGNWQGNTTSWLCTSSVPCAPNNQCGVLVPPVNGAVPDCVCTTCALDATGQGCTGSCQYAHTCVLGAGPAGPLCTCARGAPPPPTPAPPPAACGQWRGLPVSTNGVPYVPKASDYLCDPPQCAADPTHLCAITSEPTTGVAPQCDCTTCAFDDATQLCGGTCPLGAACARVAGTTRCICEQAPPPPPPPCGQYAGAKSWLCEAPECPGIVVGTDAAGAPLVQPRQCGVLVEPTAGVAPTCACTTCHYNADVGACTGRCQLGHVCTRVKGDPPGVCRCIRKTSVIVVVVVVVVFAGLIVLIVASMFSRSSSPVRRASRR